MSQSCDRSSFFSVFYGRAALAEKDNNPNDNLACDDKYGEVKYEKNSYILTRVMQVPVRNMTLRQKPKVNLWTMWLNIHRMQVSPDDDGKTSANITNNLKEHASGCHMVFVGFSSSQMKLI